MYLIEKAYRNLLANKGRNTILFLILFAVIFSSVIGLTLYRTVVQVKQETRDYYQGEVSIVPVQGDKTEGASEEAALAAADYRKFIDSDELRGHVIYKAVPVAVKGLSLFDEDKTPPTEAGGNRVQISRIGANARLFGLLDDRSTDAFASGARSLDAGSFPATAGECLISSELLERNGLKIGDRIAIEGEDMDNAGLVISGTYADKPAEAAEPPVISPVFSAKNEIIVDYSFFDHNDRVMEDARVFVLKDPGRLEAFQSELHAKGLPASYKLEYDTERYTRSMEFITELTSIIATLATAFFLVGCGIVGMLNLLALRERKYEIGVFRAIGMPKSKVTVVLLGELLILALFSAAMAIFSGMFFNKPVGNWLIDNILVEGDSPFGLLAAVKHIDISLSGLVIAEVVGVAACLALVAGLGFILRIMRFDPVKILSERH